MNTYKPVDCAALVCSSSITMKKVHPLLEQKWHKTVTVIEVGPVSLFGFQTNDQAGMRAVRQAISRVFPPDASGRLAIVGSGYPSIMTGQEAQQAFLFACRYLRYRFPNLLIYPIWVNGCGEELTLQECLWKRGRYDV